VSPAWRLSLGAVRHLVTSLACTFMGYVETDCTHIVQLVSYNTTTRTTQYTGKWMCYPAVTTVQRTTGIRTSACHKFTAR